MQFEINGIPAYGYHAAREPDKQAERILFVHGAAMEHSVWNLQSRYFAHHGYNALAVDLPGHGLSGGEPLSGIAEIADWLTALLDHWPGGAVHWVGHSMGALAALEAAARGPATSLSLLGFCAPMQVSDQLLELAENDPDRACAMMSQWSHAGLFGGEPVPGFWLPGLNYTLMRRSRPGVLANDLTACHAYQAGPERLAALKCPVLLLNGMQDRMTPNKVARAAMQACPQARIHQLPDAGHNLLNEQPRAVLTALRDFIQPEH